MNASIAKARAVASLNHPNICTLFDVGPNYLVMEYIEGESPKGPLPLDEALRIARQMGEALSEAHEKGVVHRDLKPANIKIKADGTVKVLDFGLAKMGSGPVAQSDDSPTLSMAATQAGVILGTAGYMPPEQARGKPTDKRADIWSFGVVFYELLTGRKLFQGEDVTETLAKVIQAEPTWDDVPPKVLRLLKSCLEKDPRKRLRDINDAWRLLDDAPPPPGGVREGGVRWLWPAIAAMLAIGIGIALWAPWRPQPAERPLVRLDVDLGPDISLPSVNNNFLSTIAISPDGTRIVYLASVAGGPPKLFTRRLDLIKATELPGTNGAVGPFFSPDGQWVGFSNGSKLNKISPEGGAVVPLTEVPVNAGASWQNDGTIVLAGPQTGLVRIPAGGGAPTKMLDPVEGELAYAHPQLLPGGKAVLFASYPSFDADKAHIDVVTLVDRHRKTLVPGATTPRYLATSGAMGHLIYNNKSTLFAIAFDPVNLETHGTAVPILDDLAYIGGGGGAHYAVSANGTLVYRRGGAAASGTMTLQWLDSTGKKEALRAKPGNYQNPHLSADGKRVAMMVTEGSNPDAWVYEQQRDAMQRLTFGGAAYTDPVWSPDGRFVFIGSIGSGTFWTRADGAGQPQPLTQNKTLQVPWSVSADGKRLAYFDITASPQLWTIPLEEADGQIKPGKAEQFLKTQFADLAPAFSPDGKWIAYSSNATGAQEIFVRPFPPPASGQGGQWQISNSGGLTPMWGPNHELLYQSGDQIMAVSYTVVGDSFKTEKPRVWGARLGGATAFGLSPDGKKVAVTMPVETPEAPKADHEVVFLQNFFDELRRRVPAGK